MKKLSFLLAITCASPVLAADYTDTLAVPPGFVEHWTAPRPFATVVPGTPDVVEILSGAGSELVFMLKPEGGTTNILLLDDKGAQVANLRITNPSQLHSQIWQGPNGWQAYRQDNPDYVEPRKKK
jgi:hypothetical protein